MIRERKFEVIETIRCPECGAEFSCDVLWNRDYKIRMKRYKLEDSVIASDYFLSLCSKHKLKYFGRELKIGIMRGYLQYRDLVKMGIDVDKLPAKI